MAKSSSGTGRKGGGVVSSGAYGEGVEYIAAENYFDPAAVAARESAAATVLAGETKDVLGTDARGGTVMGSVRDQIIVKPTTGVSDRQVNYANSVKANVMSSVIDYTDDAMRAYRSNAQATKQLTSLRNNILSAVNKDTSARSILDNFANLTGGEALTTAAMRVYGISRIGG